MRPARIVVLVVTYLIYLSTFTAAQATTATTANSVSGTHADDVLLPSSQKLPTCRALSADADTLQLDMPSCTQPQKELAAQGGSSPAASSYFRVGNRSWQGLPQNGK